MSMIRNLVVLGMLALPIAVQAADPYPNRTVRIIVPFAPGGSTDVVARAVAQKLTTELKQTFVIENKAGAGSAICTAQVARAPADGYTLLFTTSYFSLNPAVTKVVNYDPVKDFEPITNVAFMPMVLLVKSDLPARTVDEVLALARKSPGKLNYSSSGIGGPPHFAGALFTDLGHVDITHVPYVGAAPALADVAAGQVDMSFSTFSSAMPFIRSGRMRPIAVAGPKRFPLMPEVPTFAEAGMPGLEMATMYALLAPAGTPRPIVDRLYEVLAQAVKDPEMRKLIIDQGADIVASNPDEFAAFIRADVARWARLARETKGVEPQ
ncbi:tripartite tricarboxylate transporter substrate binding protein BugE [soil metagenome]